MPLNPKTKNRIASGIAKQKMLTISIEGGTPSGDTNRIG